MKNWMLVLGVTATMIFAASCNKDEEGNYVCTCKDADGNVENTTSYEDANLVDAQDACSDQEDAMNDNPLDPEVYICTLR